MLEVSAIITLILLDVVLLQKIADHVRSIQELRREKKELENYETPPTALLGGK
jgi:hypothetical protein